MGVQGFPTLKIVKPGTKRGKPVVEDYQGPRTAKGIVDAVVDKIPNHVKRLQSSMFDEWLADKSIAAKAVLFTDKGTTSALLRAVAIDFLGVIKVGQVRNKEADLVEKYGITKFPSIVLIPGDEGEPIIYSDEMKKQPIVEFLSQVASPNKEGASEKAKPKPSKSKDPKKSASAKSAFSKASEAHMSADLEDELGASTIVLDDNTPTESPLPIVEDSRPFLFEEIQPITSLATPAELLEAALGPKKGTCILVLLPPATEGPLPDNAASALSFFAQSADKHQKRHDSVFPFYSVPAENEQAKTLRKDLGLKESELEIVALNNKRGWWRHFQANSASTTDLETFIDNIKLGEGSKLKLPADFGAGPSARDEGHSEL
jgi:protein disulfide-isomerase A6